MEPTAIVCDAPHKQWSKGKQASESQLEKGSGFAISLHGVQRPLKNFLSKFLYIFKSIIVCNVLDAVHVKSKGANWVYCPTQRWAFFPKIVEQFCFRINLNRETFTGD